MKTTVLTSSAPAGSSLPDHYIQVKEVSANPQSHVDPHVTASGDAYYIGDIYDDQPPACAQEWEIDACAHCPKFEAGRYAEHESRSERPYLSYIKAISRSQPRLRYLAYWMQVSTCPIKWKFIRSEDPSLREDRASRTKVAMLSFNPDKDVEVARFNDVAAMFNVLKEQARDGSTEFGRLFIVEDLSRDVMERLGAEFDINPWFFREHIDDYRWYNTRDPWVQLPDLKSVSRARSFFSIRYYHARYFKSRESFDKARIQAGSFNVLRRVENTMNEHTHFDAPGSIVGLVRCKVSLWIRPNGPGKGSLLGRLVLPEPDWANFYKGYY
jgi:hypothetical protein